LDISKEAGMRLCAREFHDNRGESYTWCIKDEKTTQKKLFCCFFISASFVYFVLATPSLLITIIKKGESVNDVLISPRDSDPKLAIALERSPQILPRLTP
jgi:hypothetical protein